MKNTNKRAFTIVELVIVIAVIAILAAVLIPTFSNIINKAKKSAALQSAKNAFTEYLAEDYTRVSAPSNYVLIKDEYVFVVSENQIDIETLDYESDKTSPATYYTKELAMKKNTQLVGAIIPNSFASQSSEYIDAYNLVVNPEIPIISTAYMSLEDVDKYNSTLKGAVKEGDISTNKIYETDGTNYVLQASINSVDIYKVQTTCCFAPGTHITLSDGSSKNIEDIKVGDEILSFNHLTGKLEAQKVYYAFESEDKAESFDLCFSDGTKLRVIHGHYFFEQESRKYVIINREDAELFIGRHYYSANAGAFVELTDVIYNDEPSLYYTLYTNYNQNYFANGMLNVSDDISFFVNLFEFNEDLTVNQEQLAADFEEYGVYEYPEDAEYSRQLYDEQGLKYMRIIIGKGFGTWEEFTERFNAFLRGDL